METWAKANPRLAQVEKLRKQGASRAEINKVMYDKGTSANTYTPSVVKSSYEPDGNLIDESQIGDRARRVVGDQRQGVHGDADAIKQDMDAININLRKLRGFPNGFPSVKKDTKKTTQVAHFEPEGELVDESGYFPTKESQRRDREKYNLSTGDLPGQMKHRGTTTQAKVKPKLRSEEIQMEGIRDKDPEKGTEERKERLEKKRGMKMDDHPQYKKEKDDDDSYLETNMKKRHENNEKARKEMAAHKDDTVPRWMKDDFNLYDIILTYLDENGLMDSVEHAEAIMEQLTGEQIESIVEEILSELTPLGVKTAGVVDDQRRGSTRDKDLKDTRDALDKMKAYPKGFPGVKGV